MEFPVLHIHFWRYEYHGKREHSVVITQQGNPHAFREASKIYE